jgi:dihydrolipoamide dehydrogenase
VKHYDCIAIGTGSAMNIVEGLLNDNPEASIAVIDKDEPGGICLTKACIPSKLLVYPAEVLRQVEEARNHGIDVDVKSVDFQAIMGRMRRIVSGEISQIEESLKDNGNVDYYRGVAEFTGPHSMRVGDVDISGDMILLCTGSRPAIPNIQGLEEAGYLTSDTLLGLEELPGRLIILGGGYVAAEYGHFFSAMGSEVTMLGRNPQFLPGEEPEISAAAKQKLSEFMDIRTDHEVVAVSRTSSDEILVRAKNRETGEDIELPADNLLVAAGRAPNTDLLRAERAGLKTDEQGWLVVDEHLQTSVDNVWAFGDATGQHLFKHVANYESRIVYANAVLGEPATVEYHAVPHAVFTFPEIAAVGLGEAEAVATYGQDRVLVGLQPFAETARGQAMGLENCFAKVILEDQTYRILGAHIFGPQASILIQEIVSLMNTEDRSPAPIEKGMHIHPALSEAIEGAFFNLMPHADYQHLLSHMAPELFE